MVQATNSGPSIFVADNGESLKIWVDPRLPAHYQLATSVRAHGGTVSPLHDDLNTRYLILHPASLAIYDRYCHPSWLPMCGKFRYQRLIQAEGVDESKHKVLLTESWLEKCLAAGRLLSESDQWAACRKGGPPNLRKSIVAPFAKPLRPIPVNIQLASRPAQELVNQAEIPRIRMSSGSGRSVSPMPVANSTDDTPEAGPSRGTSPCPTQSKPRSVVRPAGALPSPSRWQRKERDPPKILEGVNIYVDSGRYGLKFIVSSIKKSGGVIKKDILQATYALLSPVKQDQEEAQLAIIESAAAKGVCCVGYDWIEDSWNAGQLLPPIGYAYVGSFLPETPISQPIGREAESRSLQIPSESRIARKLPESRDAQSQLEGSLDSIFSQAYADPAMQSIGVIRVCESLMKEHGVYGMVTWRRRYKDWRDRNGRFANLPPLPGRDRSTSSIPQSTPQSQLQAPHEQTPSQASPRPSTPPLPVSGLTPTGKVSVGLSSREDRLRQYYPMSLQGHTYVAISKALARKYPELTDTAWNRILLEWRKADDPQDYTPYRDIFMTYVSAITNGSSLKEVAHRLKKEHPSFGHTYAQWSVLFGDWLRKGERPESASTASASSSSATTSAAPAPAPVADPAAADIPPADIRRPAKINKSELAGMFKHEFNLPTWEPMEVARALQADINFTRIRMSEFYAQWRIGLHPFHNIAEELRYTGQRVEDHFSDAASDAEAELESSPARATPNPASSTAPTGKRKARGSRAAPAKKTKSDFTAEEEAKMAVYIARRSPNVTECMFDHWEEFGRENPSRPVDVWVEHYSRYRARINDLVVKLGATVPGRRANARRKTARASSTDSIEFVTVQDKVKRIEDVEVHEVLDSSSEEED